MGSNTYNLANKSILVTGGSRGIGLEIARAALAEGAKVAICGRKAEGLELARAALGNPANLLAIPAHIGKEEDVDRLFAETVKAFGRLDVLVNNVGMNFVTPSVAEADTATWTKIIDTNLNGTYNCSKRAALLMKQNRSGAIINITSIAAHKASPAMGVYGIAKAAVEMMTKVMAAELAPFNIRVNAVAPAMVRTDFSKPFWSNKDLHAVIVKGIPLGRIAEPADVVHPVLFLSSDAAAFITGQVLMVDGGASAL